MSVQPKPYYSFEDYLAAERECIDEKHEYVAGQVFAMVGATYNHNLIVTNLARELSAQLKSRPCSVLSSDMRLRIQVADACTYPDILVLCDSPSFHDGRKDVLTDATLLIEVLSPSTEGFDRGGKFALYRSLPSLRQYLLVAQDRCAVDVFTRQPDDRWLLEAYTDPRAEIPLDSIGCALPVGEIYDKVDFALPDDGPGPG
jgi:Uma2 family endonuclease